MAARRAGGMSATSESSRDPVQACVSSPRCHGRATCSLDRKMRAAGACRRLDTYCVRRRGRARTSARIRRDPRWKRRRRLPAGRSRWRRCRRGSSPAFLLRIGQRHVPGNTAPPRSCGMRSSGEGCRSSDAASSSTIFRPIVTPLLSEEEAPGYHSPHGQKRYNNDDGRDRCLLREIERPRRRQSARARNQAGARRAYARRLPAADQAIRSADVGAALRAGFACPASIGSSDMSAHSSTGPSGLPERPAGFIGTRNGIGP